jgi:citrate lyase subunit alpha/citrate CoA-transferase
VNVSDLVAITVPAAFLIVTVVTPGSSVDVVVTEYGVVVNPIRKDLQERFEKAGVQLTTMEELRKLANFMVGEPEVIEFDDEIVAVIEYRDGSIIDVVRKIKK